MGCYGQAHLRMKVISSLTFFNRGRLRTSVLINLDPDSTTITLEVCTSALALGDVSHDWSTVARAPAVTIQS